MSDMAKVIKWLEETETALKQAVDRGGEMSLMKAYRCECHVGDAIAILKDQEAVEPIMVDHIVFGTNRKCSKCNMYLFPAARYCPHCGRLVKWQ